MRRSLPVIGLLLAGLTGCGFGYYTFYPKHWVPAHCPQEVAPAAAPQAVGQTPAPTLGGVSQARGECKMEAMRQKYPLRDSFFISCMEAKGYVRGFPDKRNSCG